MSFGVYVHIPYCLQRCLYCDFATYEKSKILPPEDYIHLLKKEITLKACLFDNLELHQEGKPSLDTLYFGGGTPSLLPAYLIIDVLDHLAKLGFQRSANCEMTIEINPATVDEDKLKIYLDAGINRFSVGAQTFDDQLLKMVHREHSAAQTMQTLELLQKYNVNYNFDLLFALPHQTMKGFLHDLEIVKKIRPSHISPYCLTVPTNHVLSKSRPLDEEQIEMFDVLHQSLVEQGFKQYEISNYSRPGFESRHNLLYWQDENYWGVGLSAHSYKNSKTQEGTWGHRFWNEKSIEKYTTEILAADNENFIQFPNQLPKYFFEALDEAAALSDFCHTSLRLMTGLNEEKLVRKFSQKRLNLVRERLQKPLKTGLIEKISDAWVLTRNGIYLSNQVFECVHFDSGELH